MPMHYPPLDDGTYRVGDPARPLPSPVPGPDPGPPLPDGHSGHGPPPGDAPGEKRAGGALAAAAIIGGLGLVVVVVLGLALSGPGSDPGSGRGPSDSLRGPSLPLPQAGPLPDRSPGASFDVEGRFTVVTSPGEPVSGDGTGCEMPDTLTDIGEGTEITISEGASATVGAATLAYDAGDLSSCTFTFDFDEVPAGAAFYLIEIPGRGQLTYTEDELRTGVDITLGR